MADFTYSPLTTPERTIKRRLRRFVASAFPVAAMVALSGCAVSTPPMPVASAVTQSATPRLSNIDRWFVDESGRAIVIHGGNVSLLHGANGAKAMRYGPNTASRMAQQGFNGVRLVVFFSHIMPEPGVIDGEYLDAIAQRVADYRDQGIWTLIDFHQDEYGAKVGVRGMPDWAVLNGGIDPLPDVDFPLGYFTDPAVQKSFDAFWANEALPSTGIGLQDYYAQALAAVAERFDGEPSVMGIDVMNEPATGTKCAAADPAVAHCPELEQQYLRPFYERASTAIAEVAPHMMIFVEPFMLQGALGIPIDTPIPAPAGRRGFSYHNYGPDEAIRERVNAYAVALTENKDAAIINTEWGFNTDPLTIDAQADAFDASIISWLAWPRGAFEAIVDPDLPVGGIGDREQMLRAYARPFPAATAGTPLTLSFDGDTGRLDYRYSTTLLDGRAAGNDLLTEVHIPPVQYPEGYEAAATGATIVSQPGARILKLRNRADATQVSLTVTRIGDLPRLVRRDDSAERMRSALLLLPPVPNEPLGTSSLLGHIFVTPGGLAVFDREVPELMTGLAHVHGAEGLTLEKIRQFAPQELTEQKMAALDAELGALTVIPGPITAEAIEAAYPGADAEAGFDRNSIIADVLADPEAAVIVEQIAPGLANASKRGLFPQSRMHSLPALVPELVDAQTLDRILERLSQLDR